MAENLRGNHIYLNNGEFPPKGTKNLSLSKTNCSVQAEKITEIL